MSDWKIEASLLNDGERSWRSIAEELGISKSTVSDYLRSISTKKVIEKPRFTVDVLKASERILNISDLHAPYQHKDSIDFLADLNRQYKPTRIICLGDEVDKHRLSFHDSDPDLMGEGDELNAAIKVMADLKKLFPKMDILESNHGSLVYRKAKHHGIPRQYLKSYNDVLGVDDNWRWHFDLTVMLPTGQPCYYHHGKSADVMKLSQGMSMSCVQGHFHNDLSVKYWGNPLGLYFAVQSGCLIDDKSLAFMYNNVNIKRPIIGTSLIIEGNPILVPMKLK